MSLKYLEAAKCPLSLPPMASGPHGRSNSTIWSIVAGLLRAARHYVSQRGTIKVLGLAGERFAQTMIMCGSAFEPYLQPNLAAGAGRAV